MILFDKNTEYGSVMMDFLALNKAMQKAARVPESTYRNAAGELNSKTDSGNSSVCSLKGRYPMRYRRR